MSTSPIGPPVLLQRSVLKLPDTVLNLARDRAGALYLLLSSGQVARVAQNVVRMRLKLPGASITVANDAIYNHSTRQLDSWMPRPWRRVATNALSAEDGRFADIALSPDQSLLATIVRGRTNGTLLILDAKSLATVTARDLNDGEHLVRWAAQDQLVTASDDRVIRWSLTGSVVHVVSDIREPHSGRLLDVQPLGSDLLLTLGGDRAIRLWDGSRLDTVFESTTGEPLQEMCLSSDLRHLLALSEGGALDLHDLEGRKTIASTNLSTRFFTSFRLAGFSKDGTEFSCVDQMAQELAFYSIEDFDLHGTAQHKKSVQYRNAKVVLVGDSGVGKSGLALRLMDKPFQPTESTHARAIWSLDAESQETGRRVVETREILLWDLAGQPGYRSFHRLSLREVSVGLVVFDARSESDPFRGVPYWARALDELDEEQTLTKILVSARIDRGSVSASLGRVTEVVERYGFSQFVQTSAKRGEGVAELKSMLKSALDWNEIPLIVAPEAFIAARRFIIGRKEKGLLTASSDRLFDLFKASGYADVGLGIFVSCLRRLEAAGLVSALYKKDHWLLQPELLDGYVASMAQAARLEPDGLGQILEQDAITGNYEHEELAESDSERVMLVTAVEEVVGRGLALRVSTDEGQYLVFPSERRNDLVDYPVKYDQVMEYRLVGSVSAIYSGLAVKLINSWEYKHGYELHYNAAIFPGKARSVACGFAVDYPEPEDDTLGRVVVFFSGGPPREEMLSFLKYVDFQLRLMTKDSVILRSRVYSCCGFRVPTEIVEARRSRGENTLICSVCGGHLPMDNLEEEVRLSDANVVRWEELAQTQQRQQQRLAIMRERSREGDFHAFICYNSVDRDEIARLSRRLKEEGVLTWWDQGDLLGGQLNLQAIERAIERAPAILVMVGASSLGKWQREEYYAALATVVAARQAGHEIRLIPVLLQGASGIDDLPPFLRTREVVDLRRSTHHTDGGLRKLIHAIAGRARLESS